MGRGETQGQQDAEKKPRSEAAEERSCPGLLPGEIGDLPVDALPDVALLELVETRGMRAGAAAVQHVERAAQRLEPRPFEIVKKPQ